MLPFTTSQSCHASGDKKLLRIRRSYKVSRGLIPEAPRLQSLRGSSFAQRKQSEVFIWEFRTCKLKDSELAAKAWSYYQHRGCDAHSVLLSCQFCRFLKLEHGPDGGVRTFGHGRLRRAFMYPTGLCSCLRQGVGLERRSDAKRHSGVRPTDFIFCGSINLTSLSNMS